MRKECDDEIKSNYASFEVILMTSGQNRRLAYEAQLESKEAEHAEELESKDAEHAEEVKEFEAKLKYKDAELREAIQECMDADREAVNRTTFDLGTCKMVQIIRAAYANDVELIKAQLDAEREAAILRVRGECGEELEKLRSSNVRAQQQVLLLLCGHS